VAVRVVLNRASISLVPGQPGVQRVEAQVARELAAAMRRLCPVSEPGEFHRAGRLRDSIRARPTADGGWRVGPEVSYGRWVNNGAKPHIIRSHGTWPLRNRETGQVFGPVVHHPGNRGRHFIEEAGLTLDGRDYHT
jgi:hypothetical protein